MLELPTLCPKAPDYVFFAVKNDQMRDRRKLSSTYFISVEQYMIGMSILLTNFYLNFKILITTILDHSGCYLGMQTKKAYTIFSHFTVSISRTFYTIVQT
jgi:hypothetical protein